jgi:hypothetical protein
MFGPAASVDTARHDAFAIEAKVRPIPHTRVAVKVPIRGCGVSSCLAACSGPPQDGLGHYLSALTVNLCHAGHEWVPLEGCHRMDAGACVVVVVGRHVTPPGHLYSITIVPQPKAAQALSCAAHTEQSCPAIGRRRPVRSVFVQPRCLSECTRCLALLGVHSGRALPTPRRPPPQVWSRRRLRPFSVHPEQKKIFFFRRIQHDIATIRAQILFI